MYLTSFLLYSAVLSVCESAENAGKCAEAKRRMDSAKPNPKGAQVSVRLGGKHAAHPFGFRTRRLGAVSFTLV